MSDSTTQLHAEIIREVRRRLVEESIPRALKCLEELTEEQVWHRANANTNSVGNLVLHLCGNARQWLLSGLGETKDERKRQAEFDETGPLPKAELVSMLNVLSEEIDELLNGLKAEVHLKTIEVQGFQESGFAVLLHVVEHFSYHVGQISYFVKLRKDMDLSYYGNQNLDVNA